MGASALAMTIKTYKESARVIPGAFYYCAKPGLLLKMAFRPICIIAWS